MFHTHQCAEKALKAIIVSTGQLLPKTHDLGLLFACCEEIDRSIALLQKGSKDLNFYGQNSRYPNDKFKINEHKVIMAIDTAEKILLVIKKKLNKG